MESLYRRYGPYVSLKGSGSFNGGDSFLVGIVSTSGAKRTLRRALSIFTVFERSCGSIRSFRCSINFGRIVDNFGFGFGAGVNDIGFASWASSCSIRSLTSYRYFGVLRGSR